MSRRPTECCARFKVLVVAWVDRPNVRRTVEDIFATALTNRVVSAVASYTLIPNAQEVKRAVGGF
jgi:hypothetical protein